jgi:tRNA(Ile)-lysidine synthase TilS/MesJ
MLLDQVRQFIEEHQLFSLSTDRVLVAVSGGLDSVVLLDVLYRRAGKNIDPNGRPPAALPLV